MPTLYVAEFSGVQAYPSNETPQVALTPSVGLQTVTMTTAFSTTSSTFSLNTFIVRLFSDTNCWIKFSSIGTTVATANATAIPLAASSPEYFGVAPGMVVAAISST